MVLRAVGGEMCITAVKWNAGCLYNQKGTVLGNYSSHWSAKKNKHFILFVISSGG